MNQHQATLLKALMRAMARMMSNNQGADAMRNLIDSALPPSAQQIMRYRSRFGPQIYALGAFAHQYPVSPG